MYMSQPWRNWKSFLNWCIISLILLTAEMDSESFPTSSFCFFDNMPIKDKFKSRLCYNNFAFCEYRRIISFDIPMNYLF